MENFMQFIQRAALLVFGLGMVVPATHVSAPALAQQGGIINVPTQDKAMAAAIESAKATLPKFFERLVKPETGDERFAVKIRYDTSRRTADGEHIWANQVVREGDKVSATISNQPRDIAGLKMGQRVTVPVSRLTDWMFVRDSKYHGAYTLRAMLPFMPADQAADFKARLAPVE
jgi:uncharacterized protein YegJ (DUF2314 family)